VEDENMRKFVGGPLVGLVLGLAACSGVSGESDDSQGVNKPVESGAETESATGAFKELTPAAPTRVVEAKTEGAQLKANVERSGSGSVSSGVLAQPATNVFGPASGAKAPNAVVIRQESAGAK
jgi:hypothetical protein